MTKYQERIQELEMEGLTTSDAQGVVDVEFDKVVKMNKELLTMVIKLDVALRDVWDETDNSFANTGLDLDKEFPLLRSRIEGLLDESLKLIQTQKS